VVNAIKRGSKALVGLDLSGRRGQALKLGSFSATKAFPKGKKVASGGGRPCVTTTDLGVLLVGGNSNDPNLRSNSDGSTRHLDDSSKRAILKRMQLSKGYKRKTLLLT